MPSATAEPQVQPVRTARDLETRLRQLLADGTPLAQLTTELVLAGGETVEPPATAGVEAVDPSPFSAIVRRKASRTGRDLFQAHCNDFSGLFLAGAASEIDQETGQAVAQTAARLAARLGQHLLVEERPQRGRPPVMSVPERWQRIFLARPQRFTQRRVVDGRTFAYDPDAQRAPRARITLNSFVAAELRADEREFNLFLHPWLRGGSWQSDGDAEPLFARLLTAALAPATAADDSRRHAFEQALSILPQLAHALDQRTPQRLAQIAQRQTTLEQDLVEAQRRVVALLDERRRLTQEKTALETEQQALDTELVVRAAREAVRIAGLPTVRDVSLVGGADGGEAALRVQLHPLVMAHDGRRILLAPLTFRLPLARPRIEGVAFERVPSQPSPHPHVSTALSICWGSGAGPIGTALAAGEFASAVMLIAQWARTYNFLSPYVSIDQFPSAPAGLAAGYHQELP